MDDDINKIVKLIPFQGINLVKYSSDQLISKVGLNIIQNVVASILCGGNVRNLTETLTQRRILTVAASIFITYIRFMSCNNDIGKLTKIIKNNLSNKNIKPEIRTYLLWFLGITGKSIQNVIRDDEGFQNYLNLFDDNLADIAKSVELEFGNLELKAIFEGKNILLKWPNLLHCLLAIGASTLTIRGSEKSIYGKMFEKCVLGSLLTLLGFKFIDKTDTKKSKKVFWLSERKDKRECDATVLIAPGMAIRFDIGFIGRGNTEVSLDKVTRFEREMEVRTNKFYCQTIILIDQIGAQSRLQDMAKSISGYILQMSETYWVHSLARLLYTEFKYDCKINRLDPDSSLEYIKKRMQNMDVAKFRIIHQ